MAQTTEAACLLQTGAQYTRRIGLRNSAGGLAFAGLKRGTFSLYFDDEPIVHFDLEGRWQRAFREGVHYRKALDGSIDAIERPREGANLVLRRRSLPFAEATDFDAWVRGLALDLIDGLADGRLGPVEPPAGIGPIGEEDLRELLDRVARWDASAWFADREKYLATYGPLPLIPPDCHQSVVLQATLGQAGCPFGNGPSAEFYARTPSEFAEHVRAVAALWGRRILQANGVFLAGEDVLHRPVGEVLSYLDALAEVFPIDPGPGPKRLRDLPEDQARLEGVDAFVVDFSPTLPDAEGWHELRARNLRRVNLGIESGDPEIRAGYGRAWSDDRARAVVADLKAAGIAVRVLTLVDAGGAEAADRHVEATAGLINALELGKGDLVYLLDAREVGNPGPSPLGGSAWEAQQASLKERLAPARVGRGVKVAPYTLEKQWN